MAAVFLTTPNSLSVSYPDCEAANSDPARSKYLYDECGRMDVIFISVFIYFISTCVI